jgi:hypothetical protein
VALFTTTAESAIFVGIVACIGIVGIAACIGIIACIGIVPRNSY